TTAAASSAFAQRLKSVSVATATTPPLRSTSTASSSIRSRLGDLGWRLLLLLGLERRPHAAVRLADAAFLLLAKLVECSRDDWVAHGDHRGREEASVAGVADADRGDRNAP